MIDIKDYHAASSNLDRHNILIGLAFEIRDLLAGLKEDKVIRIASQGSASKVKKKALKKGLKSGKTRHKGKVLE